MAWAATLPDFLDADNLRTILIVTLIVLVLVVFLILNFVRKMAMRLIFIGIVVVIGLLVWNKWDDLDSCQSTCDCTLFGQEVPVPGCDTG